MLFCILRCRWFVRSTALDVAGKNGIRPMGLPTYTYLNNPELVLSEHWLTEIRIPVSEGALNKAGTFGEMTDIKKLPAMTFAVITKHEGVSKPDELYTRLYDWITKEGYERVDCPSEVMLGGAAGSYEQMKSEIMVPVEKKQVVEK